MTTENPQRDYVYAGDGRAAREMANRRATVEAAFLLPFLSPERWRRTLETIRELNDGQLRTLGLVLISAGAVLLFFIRF